MDVTDALKRFRVLLSEKFMLILDNLCTFTLGVCSCIGRGGGGEDVNSRKGCFGNLKILLGIGRLRKFSMRHEVWQ